MNNSEKYERSLMFWRLGENFLHVSKAVYKQTIKNANAWVVISDPPMEQDYYDERTEFSDFNIIVPTLFNLYHGFELFLKGFLLLNREKCVGHDIEKFYTCFKNEYPNQHEIFEILDRYILGAHMIEPLKTLFNQNSITAKNFYIAFRYPADITNTKFFNHIEVIYKGKEGIPFFKQTVVNIEKLMPLFVKLGREKEIK